MRLMKVLNHQSGEIERMRRGREKMREEKEDLKSDKEVGDMILKQKVMQTRKLKKYAGEVSESFIWIKVFFFIL